MIVEMPDRIAAVFSDYKMNLLQVRDSRKYRFKNEDVQTVFELSEYIFSRNFDEIRKVYENRNIKSELAAVIGTITESDVIMQQATENEGGYVSMCGALESLKKQGIEQGIKQGIEQEKKETVLQMLRKGMDKALIKEITRADEEMIENLHKEVQM